MIESRPITDKAPTQALDPAAALAKKIEGDMISLQHDVHNAKALQALQNDADTLRQAGARPNGRQFTQLVQKNLALLGCSLPTVEVSQSHSAMKFEIDSRHTDMPSRAGQKPLTKLEIYQAQFTPGKPVSVNHSTLTAVQDVFPKSTGSKEQHR